MQVLAVIAATRGDSDALLRQLDAHLDWLANVGGDLRGRFDGRLTELIVAALRRLVIETASASAADRAQVRAAVHLFMLRRDRGAGRVNEILCALGRQDLVIPL